MDYFQEIKDKHETLWPKEIRFPFNEHPEITSFRQLPKYYTDLMGTQRHITSGRAVQKRRIGTYQAPRLKFNSLADLVDYISDCVKFKSEHKCNEKLDPN